MTNPNAGLAEVVQIEGKARGQYDGAIRDSGGTWAAGSYKYSLRMPDGKKKSRELWINSAAEEADLFARWEAQGITAKRGRFVGR